MRVLVLGAYGNFGTIISRALARMDGIELVVAGRDAARAAALAAELGAESLAIDARDPQLATLLARLSCDWIVHTAGPFQGADYGVARAAIAAGISYVDIADGRDFVCGIAALDAAARERGVAVVSGASSVPALSGAVVDRHASRFARLRSIDIGIVSSSRLPGRATVLGVLSYCGRPFRVWREGAWQTARGWQRPRRHVFSIVPSTRWVSDCDVPDLELLPRRYPQVERVTFGAGAGGMPAQAALLAASAWGRITPIPAVMASGLHRLGGWLEPFGPSRSGMFVRLEGVAADGTARAHTWELVAEAHRGREIPCMGAVALLRRVAAGHGPPPGATPCVGLLSLDDYLAELLELPITFGIAPGS
jgi:hypothetical protein